MAKLTQQRWAKARAFYESGHSGNETAEKFGVSRGNVQTRIKEEGWTQNLEAAIKRKVDEKLAQQSAGADPKETAKAIDAEADRRVAISARHVKLAEQATQLQQQAIGRSDNGRFNPDFDTQKSAKINAETITLLITLERKIHRLEDAPPADSLSKIRSITFTNAEDEQPTNTAD